MHQESAPLTATSPLSISGGVISLGTVDISAKTNLAVTVPITLTGDSVGFDYNTTNLKITASQLNTIQDIATASSPTFLNLTLGNNGATNPTLSFDATNDGSIKWTTADKCIYLLSNSASGYLSVLSYEAGVSCSTMSGAAAQRYALQAWNRPSGAAAIAGGFWGGVSEVGTGYSVNEIYGGTFYNEIGSTTARTFSMLCGNYVANYYYGTSLSCTTVQGIYVAAVEGGAAFSGTVTDMHGIRIGAPSFSGTCTNVYGLRMDTQSGGTNTYGIFLTTNNNLTFRAGTQAIWSSAASTLDLAANTTFNFKIGANPANGTAGTICGKLNATGLGLLMGTATPSFAISIDGNAARKIWMERHTTANTAGNILTVESGGATSGATNKAGGKLVLSSGISTGNQTSSVEIRTAASGTAGTGSNTPSVKLAIAGSGAQTLTQTGGITGITQNLTNTSATSAQETKGSYWAISHTGMVDSGIYGLQMQLTGSIGAADTGASFIQGFAFEVYELGTGVGAPAGAVGGFIRHSSTIGGYTYTGFNMDIQVDTGAGAADLVLYETGGSNIGANTTSWTAFHVVDPTVTAGAITTLYGIRIDALTAGTIRYAIYAAGGQSVHAGNLKLGDTTAPTEQLEFADAKNIKFHTTTGTKIGTATSQKLAFHNSTPVIQRAGAAQAAVATTAATNVAAYGFTTAAQADAIVTLVNELRAALVEKGLIKGSA